MGRLGTWFWTWTSLGLELATFGGLEDIWVRACADRWGSRPGRWGEVWPTKTCGHAQEERGALWEGCGMHSPWASSSLPQLVRSVGNDGCAVMQMLGEMRWVWRF